MHNLVDFVEVGEARDDGQRNLGEDRLWDRTDLLVDGVKRAACPSSAPPQEGKRRTHPLSINSMHMQMCGSER